MDLHEDIQYSNEKFNKNSTDAVLYQVYLKFKILLKVKYYCIAYGINYETIIKMTSKLKKMSQKKKNFNENKFFFSLYTNDRFIR